MHVGKTGNTLDWDENGASWAEAEALLEASFPVSTDTRRNTYKGAVGFRPAGTDEG